MNTIIIGAGVSGVYLSILLKKRFPDMSITILEANNEPLKKLLATGNGRCNISNTDMTIDHYQTDRKTLVEDIIQYDIHHLEDIDIYLSSINNYIYPITFQAKSVRDTLYQQSLDLGVKYLFNTIVTQIDYQNPYTISTDKKTYHSDILILAAGTKAGLLSHTNERTFLNKLHIQPFTPTLTPMYTTKVYKELKGLRVKGTFTLTNNKYHVSQKGELLFTDYGVSGIAVMNLSQYYQEGSILHIDFYDHYTQSEFENIIHNIQYYEGFIPRQLLKVLRKYHISYTSLKDFTFHIKGLRDIEYAQACLGGISLKSFHPTLEHKFYKNLYACGEILNVTGECGGYNLHFALASAYRIYQSIERTYHVSHK